MDLKTLKLELLERIANLDDEARLRALKRLLDQPIGYATPGEHLSVVRDGLSDYLRIEDRNYTAEEVRAIVEAVREEFELDLDEELSPEQLAELEKRDREMESGAVKGYTWEEVQHLLDSDRKKQRGGE
jgi:hypothetical protein